MGIRYGSIGVDPTRTVPPAPASGGGTSSGPAAWVDLDLTTSKWAVVGNNGAGETYPNAWAATNSGTKLIITAGLEDVKGAGNKVEYNPSIGDHVNPGFGLVYKDHIDCTPAGAPSGVTADTFYSEYAVITVRIQFGQLGAATSACGYGIGGNQATDTDPWGTGAKGTATRCGIGWAFYSADQGGNPTAVGDCNSLNNYAQVVRTDKYDNQADGDSQLEVLTIAPNDTATPALRVSGTVNSDFNFANPGSVSLREGTSATTGYDQISMQIGGFPTVSKANSGGNADSNSDGAITCWVSNSNNDGLDNLPLNATGPVIDNLISTTDQMRYIGAYAHPWILIDQRGNASYTSPERAQVVIEKISVLVQPIAGRRPFPT